MPAWEREIGELPPPTFVPVGRKAGGHACFSSSRFCSVHSKAASVVALTGYEDAGCARVVSHGGCGVLGRIR
jgi:hypothetical protein